MLDHARSGMFLGNHFVTWILALVVFLAVLLLAPRVRFVLSRWLSRGNEPESNMALRVLHAVASGTRGFFIYAVALWAATRLLTLPIAAERIVLAIALVATTIQAGLWAGALVGLWIDRYIIRAPKPDPARASAAQLIRIMCLTIVWSAVLLVMLSNFGVDITGLVAGLGIGGIAIAFALQSILKDLFASLAIILDKPFVVGDFIIFDEHLGTVEQVGLKTTRIRSLSGEQISVSNDALLNTQVRNFKRMVERRIVFDLHAHHGASSETLLALPRFIAETIEAMPRTRFDRAHLADFDELGARFEIVYYVLDPGYNVYMDIQQNILAAVAGWYERNGLRFPHPTTRFVADAEMLETMAGMLAGSHQREGASP